LSAKKKGNRNRNRYKQRNENFYSDYERFASTSANLTGQRIGNRSSIGNLTQARLKQMLQDPMSSAIQIGSFSGSMKQVNGVYKRFIKYMSSLLTFDHTIYPVFQSQENIESDKDKLQEAFMNMAIFVDKLNPKYFLPIFTEKIFTSGVTFQYKLEDSSGIAYQEIPTNLCRISYQEDGVYRYQIDLSKITETTLNIYPKEIQNAYNQYRNGQTDKFQESKWYQVSDKGVAFTVDADVLLNGGVALPPFANSLIDVIKIENAKDQMEDDATLDNTKIIHSKIKTDDKGRPVIDLPIAMKYHEAIKKTLPKGAVAITNPFDTIGITLNGTGKDGIFALLDKSIDQLYIGAGISSQLFANDNSSSVALDKSIRVDVQWLYNYLLPLYENYYNYEIKKVSKKGILWKIKFLRTSYFDQTDAIKTAKEVLSFGGSRLEYLAYCGMTPLEIANMFAFEQNVLNIDDFMVAKQTSNTLSGKVLNNEAGRPKEENPTDTTVRINDSQ